MVKIWRSELGRQVRLLNDILRCLCHTNFPTWVATRKLKNYRKVSNIIDVLAMRGPSRGGKAPTVAGQGTLNQVMPQPPAATLEE
ncbi:hypothetical protein MRX96_040375 [Rhipicephalus microplus]